MALSSVGSAGLVGAPTPLARSRRAVTLAVASALLLGACSVPVASGLEESEANETLVALERNGIAADKAPDPEVEGRYRVSVRRDEASAATLVLAEDEVPARAGPGVLATLRDGSLVPSRSAEHAKLVAGIGGDLERSLRAVDGMLSARVHIAVPLTRGLGEAQTEAPTASVLLRHRGAAPPLSTSDVQRLVAGAVPGLAPAEVSVVATAVPLTNRSEHKLAHFGPITVTRTSLGTLRMLVFAALLLYALLGGAVLLLWSRWRRRELDLAEARAGRGPARRRAESPAA